MARSEDEEDGNDSEVGCCTKYSIFVFNVIFFCIGFTMIGMGTYFQVDSDAIYKKMQNSGQFATDPTLFLIFVGILIFIIGFCGCLGSLRENTILLTIYEWALIIILLIEFALVIGLYCYKAAALDIMGEALTSMIPVYKDNEDLQEIMDHIQIAMKCCGIKEPDDWEANEYFRKNTNADATPDSGGVPYSCCRKPYAEATAANIQGGDDEAVNTMCGRQKRMGGRSNDIFQVGCQHAIEEWTMSNSTAVLIVFVAILALQGTAIVMAQNLKGDIKAQKAKWVE